MELVNVSIRRACQFVALHHRHHSKPQGAKFALGVELNGKLVGVAIVGRPVARLFDDGKTAELTRLCTDGTKNACSFLYSRAKRAAHALGFTRLVTYTLPSEGGASLKAAGWVLNGKAGGGTWSRKNRNRDDNAPLVQKLLWSTERGLE